MQAPDPSTSQRLCCPKCRAIYRSGFNRCPTDGAELTSCESDPMVGTTLVERYVIEETLGEGAMGRVYRARHARLERRQFAVKILLGDLATDTAMRQRFAREAEAASRLEHPNVVSVIDFGESPEGLLYIVMELVRGNTLADVIDEEGPLDEARVIALSRGMCLGLAHAHEAGLVHRDFKPDNVALFDGEEGQVPRILDFGLAIVSDPGENATRLTQAGLVVGTPAYTAPEQARGDELDHRVDLFALGTTMYEMLAGRIPYDGTVMEVLHANIGAEPPPISERTPSVSVTPALERIVRRLLEKRPEARFQSAREVLAALDEMESSSAETIESAAVANEEERAESTPRRQVVRAELEANASSDTLMATPAPSSALAHSDTLAVPQSDGATESEEDGATESEEDETPAAEETSRRGLWMAAVVLGVAAILIGGYLTLRGKSGDSRALTGEEPAHARLDQPAFGPANGEAAAPTSLTATPATPAQPSDRDESAEGSGSADDEAAGTGSEPETQEPDPGESAAVRSAAKRPRKPVKKSSDAPPAPAITGNEPAARQPAITEDEPANRPPAGSGVAQKKPPSLLLDNKLVPPPAPTGNETQTEPTAPLDAKAAVIEFEHGGSLSRSMARRAIRRAESKFRGCYKSAAEKAGKNAAVDVSVRLVIEEHGLPSNIQVGEAPLPGLSACLEAALSDVRSRIPPDTGTERVSFTVRFSPVKP